LQILDRPGTSCHIAAGAIIMPDLDISPQRFAEIVSAYASAPAISGFLAAGIRRPLQSQRISPLLMRFIAVRRLPRLAPTIPSLLAES